MNKSKGRFKHTFIILQKVCVYAYVKKNYMSSVGRQIDSKMNAYLT